MKIKPRNFQHEFPQKNALGIGIVALLRALMITASLLVQ
jgi:hypothetical protein